MNLQGTKEPTTNATCLRPGSFFSIQSAIQRLYPGYEDRPRLQRARGSCSMVVIPHGSFLCQIPLHGGLASRWRCLHLSRQKNRAYSTGQGVYGRARAAWPDSSRDDSSQCFGTAVLIRNRRTSPDGIRLLTIMFSCRARMSRKQHSYHDTNSLEMVPACRLCSAKS